MEMSNYTTNMFMSLGFVQDYWIRPRTYTVTVDDGSSSSERISPDAGRTTSTAKVQAAQQHQEHQLQNTKAGRPC